MRLPLLLACVLLLAGCASKPEEPAKTGTGPIDLSGKLGLLAIDTTTRQVTALTQTQGVGWMSPSGNVVVWLDEGFSVLVEATSNARQIVPATQWARVFDNGTGIELLVGKASWRDIRSGNESAFALLPDAPRAGTRWQAASDALDVLAVEYLSGSGTGCANDLYIKATQPARTQGCHIRVAGDGRVGWTEATGVRVRATNGSIVNLTGTGRGDAATNSFVAHENPVFTTNGTIFLRLTGGKELLRTEIVTEGGQVLAKMEGSRRLALRDVSDDGRFLLVSAFERT
ncbi:MAG TPA: hypothetical protein VM370_11210 [Candidatus Thermoplasmatota archaeon]|nr:hypothetical protein [Candidatus Thermoplasmatota archaeon]